MEAKRPLILISNDDGYLAKGLNELIKFLYPLAEIVVVAPEGARSGSGCAITTTIPVHYSLIKKDIGLTIYKCSGTPTDCIKLSLHTILEGRRPDLIVSGINHGDNSGTNVHYSGTMGVAIEGCLNSIPSIGFSIHSHNPNADFEYTESYIQDITRAVLKNGLPPQTCLNVNFPNSSQLKGIKVCEQANGYWTQEWEPCPRKGNDNYYWLAGEFIVTNPENDSTDNWALKNDYVAITPVRVDMTAHHFIDELKNWF